VGTGTRLSLSVAAGLAIALLPAASSPAGAGQTGEKLVFWAGSVEGGEELYVTAPPGKNPRRLTRNVDLGDISPAWSPNGRRIAFAREPYGKRRELYVMNGDGTGVRRVGYRRTDAFSPDWSPDGRRLVFAAYSREKRRSDIHVVDIDGKNEHELMRNGHSPTWSPDGRRIAFVRSLFAAGKRPYDEVWLMGAGGRHARRLVGGFARDPAWSPDGERLAFSNDSNGLSRDIYTVRLDGTGLRRLTTTSEADEDCPAWSPDGARIAFFRETLEDRLFVVQVHTRRVRPLGPPLDTSGGDPDWWGPARSG